MSGASLRGARVLVVDDEPGICHALRSYLTSEGHRAQVAASGEEALELVRAEAPDIALVDYRLPGMDGLSLLREMRTLHPRMEIVLITAYGGIDTAMQATQEGAYAYLPKPLDLDEIGRIVARTVAPPDIAVRPAPTSRDEIRETAQVGESAAARGLREQLARLAGAESPVLFVGEIGSGREAAARALHRLSDSGVELRTVHCAALSPAQLEAFIAELGSVEPRFWFAMELAELDRAAEEQLLRASRGVSRLAASLQHADPGDARHDSVLELAAENGWTVVPVAPLRERIDDLPALAALLLARCNDEWGRDIEGISTDALALLRAHRWPGNLRELENAVRAAATGSRGQVMTAADLRSTTPTIASLGPIGGSGSD